jgi:hypothetical protein
MMLAGVPAKKTYNAEVREFGNIVISNLFGYRQCPLLGKYR